QFPLRLERGTDEAQASRKRVFLPEKDRRVLQHANEQDVIVRLCKGDLLEVRAVDRDIGQVGAAQRGAARPLKTSLDGGHVRARFSQLPGDGAASGAEFQNRIARLKAQMTQQVVPLFRKMIFAHPVGDMDTQFRRKEATILRLLQNTV